MWQACPGVLVEGVDWFQMLFVVKSIQSSAKSLVLELILSSRSLMKIKNRTGPKTDP